MNVEFYGGPADGRLEVFPEDFGPVICVATPMPIDLFSTDPAPMAPPYVTTYRLDGIDDDGTRRFSCLA